MFILSYLLLEEFGNKKDLFKLVNIGDNDEEFPNLYKILRIYRDYIVEKMDQLSDYMLLRWLINEGGSISTLPNKGFKDLQEEASKEKYIKLMQRIILGIFRQSNNLTINSLLPLPNNLILQINLLKIKAIEFDNNLTEENKNIIIQYIHTIFKELFMIKRKLNESNNKFVLIRFMIFIYLSSSGNFSNLYNIGHHIA